MKAEPFALFQASVVPPGVTEAFFVSPPIPKRDVGGEMANMIEYPVFLHWSTGGILILLAGYWLDRCFGDPVYPFHPVRLIGQWIAFLDAIADQVKWRSRVSGVLLVLLSCALPLGGYAVLNRLCGGFPPLRYILDLGCVYTFLALGDLLHHGQQVAQALKIGDCQTARHWTGFMVSRDVDRMDEGAMVRAVVESIAENLNDGVIAPIFWFVLGGVPALIVFKVVSTLDSMVGYRDERYQHFGWASARLDDILNFLPARMTYFLIALAAFILPGYSWRSGLRTGWFQ
ncbi:MAG: cobalamin biosynthesis protein CobD, partial [Lentisphaerae bacterium]